MYMEDQQQNQQQDQQQDQQHNYCVYIHKNKENGKEYIGITGQQDPNKRWRNGTGYHDNPYFEKAIEKYGWDGFDHIIVRTELTQDEAFQAEKDLIKEHDTTNKDKGYNISGGGQSGRYIDGRSLDPEYLKKKRLDRYYENRDKEMEYAHQWYLDNIEHRKEYSAQRYQDKKDYYHDHWVKYYQEHKEELKQKRKEQNATPEQKEKNKKRFSNWYAQNKEKVLQKRKEQIANETSEEREARLKHIRELNKLRRQKKKEEQHEYNQDGPGNLCNDPQTGD